MKKGPAEEVKINYRRLAHLIKSSVFNFIQFPTIPVTNLLWIRMMQRLVTFQPGDAVIKNTLHVLYFNLGLFFANFIEYDIIFVIFQI